MNLINIYHYLFVNILYYFNNKYWFGKKLYQKLPFSQFKSLKISQRSIYFDDSYIGDVSIDNKSVIIKNEEILIKINKNNTICFHNDFVELSQMVYFIYCYLFVSDNPIEYYKERWAVFLKFLKSEKINSFGYSIKVFSDLLTSLNNGKTPKEFSNTLSNFRIKPPIFSRFGVIFDKKNEEYSLLHYVVKLPNNDDHLLLTLLEKHNIKFYKISKCNVKDIDLINKIGSEITFKFDISDFLEYKNVSEFIGQFSMLIVRAINSDYKDDSHPTLYHKMIFDMMDY